MKTVLLLFAFLLSSAGSAQTFQELNSKNILDFANEFNSRHEEKNIVVTVQTGKANYADILNRDGTLLLRQNGNYNQTLFKNLDAHRTDAQVTVNGSNNYVDIVGSNSISEGMKININANDMTIFMRNY